MLKQWWQTPVSKRYRAEVLTLRKYLERDLYSRIIASSGVILVTVYALGSGFVLGALVLLWTLEVFQWRLMRTFSATKDLPRWAYWAMLATAFMAATSYVVPIAVLWGVGSNALKSVALLSIMGGLLHISITRPSHLPMAIATAAPMLALVIVMADWMWGLADDPITMWLAGAAITFTTLYYFDAMRTNHYIQNEMANLQMEAEQRDAAKSQFLARTSHEIRTTLNGIIGVGHLLRKAPDMAKHQIELEILSKSTEMLRHLVDNTLDQDAVERGAINIRRCVINLEDEIRETFALFRTATDDEGLDVRLDIAADVPTLGLCDPLRLKQVMGNLIANATRHTSAGVIRLSLRLNEGVEDGLEIRVQDSGEGIAPDRLNTLFSNAAHPRMEGVGQSGLGLSISRAIARAMGGDLRLADPQPARGACFVFTFLAPEADTTRMSHHAVPQVRADLEGQRILVVDDVASNRFVLASVLRSTGATIEDAESGEKALEQASEGPVDLVFVDLNMPGMNGYDTRRALRAAGCLAPIYAVTADVTGLPENHPAARDFDGVLAKPLDFEVLNSVLNAHAAASKA